MSTYLVFHVLIFFFRCQTLKMSEELDFMQIFERGILIQVDATNHHYEIVMSNGKYNLVEF